MFATSCQCCDSTINCGGWQAAVLPRRVQQGARQPWMLHNGKPGSWVDEAEPTERIMFDGAMPTKKILITGGAGFIGSNAARYFGTRNWNITVLDNL